MRKPQGYAIAWNADGSVNENDSTTCGHCNRVTLIKPFMDPAEMGGLCKCCMRLICSQCVGNPCDVIEQKLERWEAADRLYRDMRG